MASKKVQNRQASGRAVLRRRGLIYGLGAGAVAVLLAVLATPSAGPASAQDATQPVEVQQPPGAPGAPTADPITNEQIELLKESGLIDKQSRLSEGLLLMERQLRQAQLVGELLTVLGPDAQIEVTPGEFKSFADTPAGLQQRIQYLKLQSELQAARLESGVGQQAEASVSEIYGKSGDLVAVITLEGRKKAVALGDQFEDGTEVLSITAEGVDLQRSDGTLERLRAP